MRTVAALLAAVGGAAAGGHKCPAHGGVAEVYLGTPHTATPLYGTSDAHTGVVHGRPWSWIPDDNVVLGSFPEEQNMLSCGNYYGYPCRRTENGTQITVRCKSEVCDVYAFVYHEPPRSTQTNGRLPLTLPANDWQAGSCAPRFCLTVADTRAPTAATPAPSKGPVTSSPSKAPTGSPVTSSPSNAPTDSTGAPVVTIPPMPPVTSNPTRRVVSHGPGGNPDAELPDARKAGALDAEVECCKMTAFRKQVDGDASVSFSIDEAFSTMDAYYTIIAVAPGVRCSSNARQTSQAACEEDGPYSNAQCRWVPSQGPASAARKAGVLSGIPTSSPTGSPVGGRCVDNWCPRPRNPPPLVPGPACSAPLTEPECHAPPLRFQ